MLRAEIGDRPNVAEVLRHPWMLVDIPPELAALNDRLVQVCAAAAEGFLTSGPCFDSTMPLTPAVVHAAGSPASVPTGCCAILCSSSWPAK